MGTSLKDGLERRIGGSHPNGRGASGRRRPVARRFARRAVAALATACAAVAWAGEVVEDGVTFTSTPDELSTYAADDVIRVEVEFNEVVTVTGAPTFDLLVGGATRRMYYDGGSDTTTLRFAYAVVVGDLDADGVSYGANPLRGGTIVSGDPAAAVDRTIPAIGRADGHRVDARGPRVEHVRFTSNAGADNVYMVGEDLLATVTFDEPVTPSDVELALTVGAGTQTMTLVADTSPRTALVFRYTVAAGHEDTNGVSLAANALAVVAGSSGSVVDAVGNAADLRLRQLPSGAAHRVDGVAPRVTQAPRVVSGPAGGTYQVGEWIEVALDFTENVVATGGTLVLLVGDPGSEVARPAAFYAAGSSGRRVVYRYQVQDDDVDGDGVSVRADAADGQGVTDIAGNPWDDTHPAMAEQRAHRVGTLPASVSGTPRVTSAGPYSVGEAIAVEVDFNVPVYAADLPNVYFRLQVGNVQKRMTYQDGTGDRTLRFRYAVQAGDMDADGIGWDANALVGSGVINGPEGRAVDRTVPRVTRLSAHVVDGVAPTLRAPVERAVEIVSTPASADGYRAGETIEVRVAFSEPVTADHDPELRLALDLGGESVHATLVDGDGTSALEFHYRVQDGDADGDGVAVTEFVSGSVLDLAGNAFAGAVSLANQTGHPVNGTAPAGAAVSILSSPGADNTYAAGDRIEIQVLFGEAIRVSGSPELVLSIRAADRPGQPDADPPVAPVQGQGVNRRATLVRTRPNLLVFRYTVQDGDFDDDGIAIAPGALVGGTIEDAVGNPVNRTLGTSVQVFEEHRVDAVPPSVYGVQIRSVPGDEGFYVAGDVIEVEVTFSETVYVSAGDEGPLRLELSIGAQSRAAAYVRGGGTPTLLFRYEVQLGDRDDDGISIGPDALVGGVIEDEGGTDFDFEEDGRRRIPAVPRQPGHKVSAAGVPVVREIRIPPPPDGTFDLGDEIRVEVTFDRTVFVTGEPVVTLSIGGQSRDAALASGSGTERLVFVYVVAVDDRDTDGISLPANALGSGCPPPPPEGRIPPCDNAITDEDGNQADTSFRGLPANAALRVDGGGFGIVAGGVSIASDPGPDGAYGLGDVIEVRVVFETAVHATGDPVLTIAVGGGTRAMALASGSGTDTLAFRYTVAEGDADEDGVSIGANAISGGEIADGLGRPVVLGFAALPADPDHRIEIAVGPGVADVYISSDPGRDGSYGLGDTLEVRVEFDVAVHVTGAPVLTVSLGGGTRDMALFSGSGTDTLTFRYTVAGGDNDEDGVSIAANALTGGVIEDGAGQTVARDFAALPADPDHRIETAGVAGVFVSSEPGPDGAYGVGDTLEVRVRFDVPVHVTGAPVLTLSLGGGTRDMALFSGSGTDTLTFRYTIADGDRDEDGVSVAANALTGGVIEDGAGQTVARDFAALPADENHRVDGTRDGRVVDVAISSTPPGGGVYVPGDTLEVRVVFDVAVHVTGAPVLTLSLGGGTRDMALFSGSGTDTLTFRYTIAAGDRDEDGVSVAANALTGGVIEDGAGQAVARDFPALPADRNHRVETTDGPGVADVSIASDPGPDGAYGVDDTLEVRVVFDVAVHVTGAPVLTLSLGGGTRDMALFSGSGTNTLTFRYTVAAGDRDEDGVSVAANALTGGVIEDGAGRTVARDFAALPADENHRVDGTPDGRVVEGGVTITSAPMAGGMYVPGEVIEVTVRFDRVVHVTGDAAITVSVGANSREAAFESGSGTAELVFRYPVEEGDRDDDGISIGANALAGDLQDGGGRPVNLDFPAIPRQPDHRVGPASETVLRVETPPLSPGQPWRRDLAALFAEAGVGAFGALEASPERADVARAEVSGTVLSVTAVAEGLTTVEVTASRARLRVLVTVLVRTDPAERAVLEDALATIGRGMLWNAVNTIGTRLELAGGDLPTGGGPWVPGDDPPGDGPAVPGSAGPIGPPPDAADAAGYPGAPAAGASRRPDMSFSVPLGNAAPERLSWGVWGGGDYWSFENEPDVGEYDGNLASAYVGVDVSGLNWVVGVAASRARAEVDYEFAGALPGEGAADLSIDSIYPYLQWSPSDRVRLWGMLGFGSGEIRPERDGRDVGLEADLSMAMGAVGASVGLGQRLGMDLALRGDAGFLQLETDEGIGPAHDLSVGVHHARLGVTASWSYHLGDGLLTPFVEAGGRFDGGDGQGGAGLEVAGGVRYRGPLLGMELKGRTVAVHGARGHGENGVTATLVLGRDGDPGWSLSLAPRWGGSADPMDLAWQGDYRRMRAPELRPTWGLGGRLSRGIPLRQRPGIVIPFGELDFDRGEQWRARAGFAYRLDATPWQPPLHIELAGERVRIYPDHTDHRISVTGRAAF